MASRLHRDLNELMLLSQEDRSITAFPIDETMRNWTATIRGGQGTAYDDLSYKLSLEFPEKYPFVPPTIKFSTPCYHPNVDMQGNICIDILKEQWSSSYNVRIVLLSIQSLLADPNLDSPLNAQAAELWKNKKEYAKTVLERYEKDKLKELNK